MIKYFSWQPYGKNDLPRKWWSLTHITIDNKKFLCGLKVLRKSQVFDYSSSSTANILCAKCEDIGSKRGLIKTNFE